MKTPFFAGKNHFLLEGNCTWVYIRYAKPELTVGDIKVFLNHPPKVVLEFQRLSPVTGTRNGGSKSEKIRSICENVWGAAWSGLAGTMTRRRGAGLNSTGAWLG